MSPPEYHVAGLAADRGVAARELSRVFEADWRQITLVTLAAGERLGPRELHDSEVMAFVIAGQGTAELLDGPVLLRPSIALTLFRGERLDITAAAEPLELFVAEIGAEP